MRTSTFAIGTIVAAAILTSGAGGNASATPDQDGSTDTARTGFVYTATCLDGIGRVNLYVTEDGSYALRTIDERGNLSDPITPPKSLHAGDQFTASGSWQTAGSSEMLVITMSGHDDSVTKPTVVASGPSVRPTEAMCAAMGTPISADDGIPSPQDN